MAQLPRYRQQATAQLSRLSGSTRKNVDSSLSQGLSSLGQGLGDLARAQEALEQREARDYVLATQNEMTVAIETERQRLANEVKTGSEYLDGMKSFLESQKQIKKENASSGTARKEVEAYFNGLTARESESAIKTAAAMNAQRSAEVTTIALDQSLNDVISNPENYEKSLESGLAVIQVSDMPESRKAQAIDEFKKSLTANMFDGLIKTDPTLAKEQLESGNFNAALDPRAYAQLLNRAQQQDVAKKSAEKQKLTSEIQDYISYKNSGGDQLRQYSEAALTAVYGDNGAEIYKEIQSANNFADNYNKIKYASIDDLKKIVDAESVKGPENFRQESAQQANIIKAIELRNEQLSSDPAGYVSGSDIVSAEFDHYQKTGDATYYASATIAEQIRLGIPPEMTTVLSDNQARAMISAYDEGGENAAQLIASLRGSFGNYYTKALGDLIRNGLSPNAATVAVLPEGSRAAAMLAQADSEGLKMLKETISQDDLKKIQDNSLKSIKDFSATAYSPSTRAQVRKSVELLAVKYLSNGTKDNASDALELATDEILNDRYEYYSTYRVPIERSNDAIQGGVINAIDSVYDMDLLPPLSDLPEDLAMEAYRDALIPKAVTLNDDSGIIIYDQNNEPVLDKDGNLITFTWDQLSRKEKVEINTTLMEAGL